MFDFNREENVSYDANQPAAPRSGPTQQNFDKNNQRYSCDEDDQSYGDLNDTSMTVGNSIINFNESSQGLNMDRLTNKKKQYLQDEIVDKNGQYSYLQDPIEYKKARKRLQNRESAVRSRQRKKTYQETLEQEISEINQTLQKVKNEKNHFAQQVQKLQHENQNLRQQVSFFQDQFATSSLAGSVNETELDLLKLQILSKINRRFIEESEFSKKNQQSESMKDLNQSYSNKKNDYKIVDKKCNLVTNVSVKEEELILRDTSDELYSIRSSNQGDKDKFFDIFEGVQKKQNIDDLLEESQVPTCLKRARINSGSLFLNEEDAFSSDLSTKKLKNNLFQKVETSKNPEDLFVLRREYSQAKQSKGYFFLAAVFGMLCCSSYVTTNPQDQIESNSQISPGQQQILSSNSIGYQGQSIRHFQQGRKPLTQNSGSRKVEDSLDAQLNDMNLASSDVSDQIIQDEPQNHLVGESIQLEFDDSGRPLKSLELKLSAQKMKVVKQNDQLPIPTAEQLQQFYKQIHRKQQSKGPFFLTFKNMLMGEYTYLTYAMCSTACLFFWIAPSYHRVKILRKIKRVNKNDDDCIMVFEH